MNLIKYCMPDYAFISISQSVSQSVHPSVRLSSSQSVSQSVNESINQSKYYKNILHDTVMTMHTYLGKLTTATNNIIRG